MKAAIGKIAMKGSVVVKALGAARRHKRKAEAVVTVEDPGLRNGLRFHTSPHPDHIVLRFEDVDIVDESVALPMVGHVEAVLRFARDNMEGTLLVHCKAGIARSTALALAIIADRLGPGREHDAVAELIAIRPEAVPNLLMLGFADDLLERSGRLVEAWDKIERSDPEYAEHRRQKLEILHKRPELFARAGERPLPAMRFRPQSTRPEMVRID
jgi:predicted protein tyrosine phosphatase